MSFTFIKIGATEIFMSSTNRWIKPKHGFQCLLKSVIWNINSVRCFMKIGFDGLIKLGDAVHSNLLSEIHLTCQHMGGSEMFPL